MNSVLPVHAQLRNHRPVKSNLFWVQKMNNYLLKNGNNWNFRKEKEKEKEEDNEKEKEIEKKQPSQDENAECGSTVDEEVPASSKQSTIAVEANCSGSVSSSSTSKNVVSSILVSGVWKCVNSHNYPFNIKAGGSNDSDTDDTEEDENTDSESDDSKDGKNHAENEEDDLDYTGDGDEEVEGIIFSCLRSLDGN